MKKIYSLLSIPCFLLISIFYSCSSQDDNIVKINIDNANVKSTYDISNFIDKISIIPLQELKGNYLGSVFKLFVTKDKFIAFDRFQSHKISLFTKDGIFLKTILKTGDGPQDAFQINDCLVENGKLEAFDYAARKIYKFDSNFDLERVVKLAEIKTFKSISKLNRHDEYVAYSAFNEYNPQDDNKYYHLSFLDSKLNYIKNEEPIEEKFLGIDWLVFKNNFTRYNDTIRYYNSFNNYISNIDSQNQVKVYAKLVYLNSPLPDDLAENLSFRELSIMKDRSSKVADQLKPFEGYAYFNGTWIENNNMLYILSNNKDHTPFISLLSKKNKFPIINTRTLKETKKFKMKIPFFDLYNEETDSYYTVINGKYLRMHFERGCIFDSIVVDPEMLYVVKTTFKK